MPTEPSPLKLCVMEWWRQRDPIYSQVAKPCGAKWELVGEEKRRVAGGDLYKVLVPDYKNGWFTGLSAADKQKAIRKFNRKQIRFWEKKIRERQEKKMQMERKKIEKTQDFYAEPFEVVQNISDNDALVSCHKNADGTMTPAQRIDAQWLLQRKKDEIPGYTPLTAILGYSPWQDKRKEVVFAKDDTKYWIDFVNTFRASWWQEKGILPKEEAVIPPLFEEYLFHLFPDKKSRAYVFAWIYRMIWGQNQTALVLNGAKGIGKGLFINFLAGLCGPHNLKTAKTSILESQFNDDLKECLCYYFDEIPCFKKGHLAKFKMYCNDELSLEAKGKEAKKEMTYKSIVMNNNGPADIRVDWSDRRFNVPEVTRDILADVWPDEKVKELVKMLKDAKGDHYHHMGSWIYHHAEIDRIGPSDRHQGARFQQMVLASLTPWQAHLRSKLLEERESEETLEIFREQGLSLDEVKIGLANGDDWPRDAATIQTFLDSHIEVDKRLGVLELTVENIDEENPELGVKEVHKIFPPEHINKKPDLFDYI